MIEVDGELTVDDVAAVARNRERVELSDEAVEEIERTRAVVRDVVAAEERKVYGVNTGYGPLKDVVIPRERLGTQQVNLLRSHDVTVGERFPIEVVRAAMLVRANVLSMGMSGVRPVLVWRLLALLNEGVHPVIRKGGNTDNAAGLANVGLVLIGEGEAVVDGERVTGRVALDLAGLDPLELRAKEGLALISGTAMMTALVSLGVVDVETLLDVADLAGAWTFDLVGKEPSAFAPEVAEVHPHEGQATVAANVLALVDARPEGSDMSQDPLSLRCIPQIHGAARQFLEGARTTVETELASVTDNPLVLPDGRVLSNGNFNGQHVATAADALGRSLLKVGWTSEQRFARLLEGSETIPTYLTDTPGVETGLSRLQYAAGSLMTDASTAGTASAHSFVTAGGQEDVHAVGNIAGIRLRNVVEKLQYVVAAELVAASRATGFVEEVSAPIRELDETLRASVDVPEGDVRWGPRVEEAVSTLRTEAFRTALTDRLSGG